MKLRIVVSVVLVLVVLGLAAGGAIGLIRMRKEPERRKPEPNLVQVVAPEIKAIRDHQVEIVGYGSARPKVRLQIAPQVGGEIIFKSEKFLSGRMVRGPKDPAGPPDVLFRIDPEKFQLAVDNARQQIKLLKARTATLNQEKANLEEMEKLEVEQVALAKDQLDRTERVLSRGASTQNELNLIRASLVTSKKQLQTTRNQLLSIPHRLGELAVELEAANVRLRQADLDLKHATYTSPVTGRLIGVEIERGEQVQVGKICGEIYGTRFVEIPVSVPAGDVRWISQEALRMCIGGGEGHGRGPDGKIIKAKVEWVESDTGRTVQWAACLERAEAGLEAQTRTARLVILVDNAPPPAPGQNPAAADELMLDLNMYCKVTIYGKTIPVAYLVPRSAILSDDSVYVVRDDKLAKQPVKVARYTDNQAMILPGGGIEEGDRVILSYVPRPVIGMTVAVAAEATEEPPASRPLAGESAG